MYTSKLKIVDTANFALWSLGNGAAYTLVNSAITCNPKAASNSLHLQGDDASEFRQQWEAWEKAQPDWPTDRIMRELWNAYKLP